MFQSRNWEPFKIDGEQYLVIASFQDNSVCPIYKWNSKQFVKFKGLPCSRAFDVEPFELNGAQHVAVANFDEDRGKPVVVFKWDGSGFTELQKFDITAQYVEVFKVNDDTYLGISGWWRSFSIFTARVTHAKTPQSCYSLLLLQV